MVKKNGKGKEYEFGGLAFIEEFYKDKRQGKGKVYYNFKEEEVKYYKGNRIYKKDCILI